MGTYTIHHALHEDINEASVWMGEQRHPSRTIIKIVNPRGGLCSRRSVYCAVRQFDEYYDKRREDHKQKKIPQPWAEHVAMSEWYRATLAIDRAGDTVKAELFFCNGVWLLRDLRAACCHPDFAVRLATRLGVAVFWLGAMAVYHEFAHDFSNCPILHDGILVVSGIFFVLSIVACRSPRLA